MQFELEGLIAKLHIQNDVLGFVREKHLELQSTRKHYESKLVSMAQGKSHAERQTFAYASEAYRELMAGISKVEADYEFEKLKFSILEKEFQATYLSLKMNEETLRKG